MRRCSVIIAAALIVAGCSGGGSKASGLTQCSTVFAAGATFTSEQFHAGCLDDKAARVFVAVDCTDGRKLATFDRAWAFVGDTVHADHAGYDAAYRTCT